VRPECPTSTGRRSPTGSSPRRAARAWAMPTGAACSTRCCGSAPTTGPATRCGGAQRRSRSCWPTGSRARSSPTSHTWHGRRACCVPTSPLWKLYVADPEHGRLGYAGFHDWPILEGRHLLAVLFEDAATLELLDVEYVLPAGCPRRLQRAVRSRLDRRAQPVRRASGGAAHTTRYLRGRAVGDLRPRRQPLNATKATLVRTLDGVRTPGAEPSRTGGDPGRAVLRRNRGSQARPVGKAKWRPQQPVRTAHHRTSPEWRTGPERGHLRSPGRRARSVGDRTELRRIGRTQAEHSGRSRLFLIRPSSISGTPAHASAHAPTGGAASASIRGLGSVTVCDLVRWTPVR
jgi:hypothetical protein